MAPPPPGRTHAFLVATTVPLFLGTLFSDWAYYVSYQIQWSNFASWLLVGALVFSGAALVFAIADWLRLRSGTALALVVLQALVWITGFWNALVHARDAWAAMPTGLVLSVITGLLAMLAAIVLFVGLPRPLPPPQTLREGGAR